MIASLMNNELEKMCKKWSRKILNSRGRVEENQETRIRITGVLAEIRTRYLPYKSQKRSRLSQLAR
jgi:hypothetical protein